MSAIDAIGGTRPGQTVVEYTGGSTGSSLAFVCAIKGYPLRIVSETGAFWTDQFNITDMLDGYRRLGEELLEQLPDLLRVVVEPAESAVLSGGPPGTDHIEGGGIGRWPPQLRPADFDEVIAVPQADAFAKARAAARSDGIFSGPSTGANLVAAGRIAARLGAGHRVVTLQVDSGLKYLAGDLYR